MNFNNIPKGLLAPLFFGEISINGNVPDGGGIKPQPPLISCTGALNVTDPFIIYGDWKLEVDGELVLPDATNIDDVIAYLTEAGFEVTIEPDTPTISCVGASYNVTYVWFLRIGAEPSMFDAIVIDGITYDGNSTVTAFPSWFEIQQIEYPAIPPEGFELLVSLRFVNNDTISHIVEVLNSSPDLKFNSFENTSAVVIEPNARVGVCLQPAPR